MDGFVMSDRTLNFLHQLRKYRAHRLENLPRILARSRRARDPCREWCRTGHRRRGREQLRSAQEVRDLAQRSSTAAKEIKALITASNKEVKTGASLVNETGAALEVIVREVNQINENVSAIVGAAREQSVGLQEINQSINSIDRGTQQNAVMAQETTAASHTLATETRKINEMLEAFKIDQHGANEGYRTTEQEQQLVA